MAGIGFELRKLFREQGLVNNIKAYAYSSLTTIGPMIISMFLIILLQRMMSTEGTTYLDWELYTATVSYSFIFSIIITSGFTMVLTRYVADMIYQKYYDRLMSSYYGSLIILLPLSSVTALLFLINVSAGIHYKAVAFLFFVLLTIVWVQGVYLSALKDYVRIVRGFVIGTIAAIGMGWFTFYIMDMDITTAALLSLDVGFFLIVILSAIHFEQRFPRANVKYFFEFLKYYRKHTTMFFTGVFVYSGVYLHNFVYWLSDSSSVVADQFKMMPFYDLPVFFAFISVMPTLVTFVISVETAFYTKFKVYYMQVLEGGTIADINEAKLQMQQTLIKQISKLMEIQILCTILAVALGIKFLPNIGFSMRQLDLFIILALAYFLFIVYFVITHILMYFDDQKGVFGIGLTYFILNIVFTFIMMRLEFDGVGMFIASFITLLLALYRLKYVLKNIDYFTFCSQPINSISIDSKIKVKKTSKKIVGLTSLIILVFLLSACSNLNDEQANEEGATVKNRATMPETFDTRLVEDKRIYERDDDSELKTLYITVLPPEDAADKTDWYTLNRQTDPLNAVTLPAIVQEGLSDGKGPKSGMFGYDDDLANATIEIRGNSTWFESQKSYGIRLKPDAGTYLDQRKLNLNKHVADLSRMRNKLSFDLMETIPNMSSLRTQYIHVYVKDLSNNNSDTSYQDLGLFTHIEQPNKKFLKAHLLDPNGHVYKAINFEYFLSDEIKNYNDPAYDEAMFEQILEIKGNKDHSKLIRMLEDVNNLGIPIEETIAKHFDEENFLTWTALNILIDNVDTMSQNFYLYSPLNSEIWYLLPWDYDYSFHRARNRHPFQHGISTYWGNVIHSRYFRSEKNVEKLLKKVEELEDYVNQETIAKQIDKYRDIVEPFLHRMPDKNYLPKHVSEFDAELNKMIETPKLSKELLMKDIERPKPFYVNDVEVEDGKLKFSWGISFDIQDDKLRYQLTIAKDAAMNNVLFSENDLAKAYHTSEMLPKGIYYMKVTVKDEKGNEQYAFDYIEDKENTLYYFGTKQFEVK
ncbi:exopolysaccharide Pel transporter PelG [Paenibacillus yanchengensis]|uniref:Exopolysaccharide Pel transporter PelG n=1 Tax=Paenibacillus yanchengensis TaxID=2035833 RepID=A0ABW4YQQ8_9BACL